MTDTAPFDWRYLLRVVLGLVFIWAALAKIGDVSGFALEIHNYRVTPLALENIFAMTIPWIELVAGVALLLNLAPRAGTLVLGAMLILFTILILSAIVRGLDIACGCFGTSDAARTGWETLLRDIAFLAMAWFGYPRAGAAARTRRAVAF